MVVTKGVRKLTSVMVELFFLILLYVQANNLVLASVQSSSPPIMLPYSFEVDEAQEMYECGEDVVEGCERHKTTWPLADLRYQTYIFNGFARCFPHDKISEHLPTFKDCLHTKCLRRPKWSSEIISPKSVHITKCYEKHIKMP